MPYAAITYDVKPGFEAEIAEIFRNFKRADTPVLRDPEGREIGRLLGTAVFQKKDLLIRVIHYEGEISEVGRHMAQQRGVHALEEKLMPYLSRPRDTETPEGFRRHFADSLMTCISQLTALPVPAAAE
jgi:SchA/CurD like domain-containing protein